ncbi:CU044_5270 family protein [Embleya sp. NPDC005575]|uniref:CU044_5270 family protein n=1 Tax=Embleya sp. NPDC005575 TaxID=3156892 RepID=UPI0033B0E210
MKPDTPRPALPDHARAGSDPTERALARDAHPSPTRQRLLEEHLMREITGGIARVAPSRRRAFRLMAPIGAMVAAGAVVAAVSLVAGPDSAPPRPAQMVAAALDAFGPPAIPRPGQVLYVEYELSSWSGVDGVPIQIPTHPRMAWYAQDGRRWFFTEPGAPATGLTIADPPMRWNYAELAALPATPEALAAALHRQNIPPLGSNVNPDQAVFEDIENILTRGVLPPGVAEALYEVAARTPGVSALADAVDGRGRRGIALTRTDPVNGMRMELVFDRDSRIFLGSRAVRTRPGENHPIGTVMWQSTVLKRDIVDTMPEDPVAGTDISPTPSTTSNRRS